MASMFALIGMSLLFAQYFQLVRHWSPLQAGLAGLPGAGAAMVGAVLAAPLVARLGRARVVALGLALTSAAQLMYVRIGVDTGYLTMVVAMLVAGLGATLTFTVTSDTLLAAVPKERAGAAAAIAETAQELGGGLGMAVLGTVLNSSYRHTVTVPDGLPVEAGRSVRDSLGAALDTAAALPADLARGVAAAANQAFVHGMHAVELTNAGLIAAVAVATLVALRGLPAVLPTDDPTDDPDPADAAARAAGQSTPSSDLTGSIAK
jgi:DHA2 family multidrug resistance protein-like MFS transporter